MGFREQRGLQALLHFYGPAATGLQGEQALGGAGAGGGAAAGAAQQRSADLRRHGAPA